MLASSCWDRVEPSGGSSESCRPCGGTGGDPDSIWCAGRRRVIAGPGGLKRWRQLNRHVRHSLRDRSDALSRADAILTKKVGSGRMTLDAAEQRRPPQGQGGTVAPVGHCRRQEHISSFRPASRTSGVKARRRRASSRAVEDTARTLTGDFSGALKFVSAELGLRTGDRLGFGGHEEAAVARRSAEEAWTAGGMPRSDGLGLRAKRDY